jgi:poly(hydroxyalkanoate) depolymerase family esterase
MKLNEGFLARMRDATALLQSQGPAAATQAIQEALRGLAPQSNHAGEPTGAHSDASTPTGPAAHAAAKGAGRWKSTQDTQPITDVYVDDALEAGGAAGKARTAAPAADATAGTRTGTGRFIQASFSSPAGKRDYKVYIPSAYAGQALPLVVMLHGCKQEPDDFAMGTGMNLLAEQNDFFVVYPAQAQRANGSNCWNWFQVQDQQRDRGEPSIIADITRQVIGQYKLDATRCYVAGLSAGGAMAAILGQAYPDLYAAVGVHSGLAAGAAHDVMSAFNAMRQGAAGVTRRERIPIIVFHGDRDTTVHPLNGKQVIEQYSGAGGSTAAQGSVIEHKGMTPQGCTYTTSIHQDGHGKVVAEFWGLHGAGHAWSGGSSKGSYTDPAGPDASREMLRFFLEHPLAGDSR